VLYGNNVIVSVAVNLKTVVYDRFRNSKLSRTSTSGDIWGMDTSFKKSEISDVNPKVDTSIQLVIQFCCPTRL